MAPVTHCTRHPVIKIQNGFTCYNIRVQPILGGGGDFFTILGRHLDNFSKAEQTFYTKNSKITILKLQFRKKKKHLRVTIINGQWGGKFTSL